MYKKSFFVVMLVLLFVGGSLTFSSIANSYFSWGGKAPSAYDPKITVSQAMNESKTPLLIEFYSDTCGTCRELAPMIHEAQKKFKGQLYFVMVNTDDPLQVDVVSLFNIQEIPALYVFDFHKMRKQAVPSEDLFEPAALEHGIQQTMQKVAALPARKVKV